MGSFASGFATPTHMGEHESLEAGEALLKEELKWRERTRSLFRKAKQVFTFCHLFA